MNSISLKTAILNSFRTVFKISILENWLRNKTFGKTPNNLYYKLTPNNYQYKKNSFRTFNYKGIQLLVDIRDYVGHSLYFGFKDEAHEKLMALVQPHFTILDIGTNIGSTLLQFANKLGGTGSVYGFEPDLINYNACIKNIELNSFHNINVANIGLGNESGKFNLVVDTETNRAGNRIQFNIENNKNATTIIVERLDDWLKEKPENKIDLIKIDVEGFEMNVLKGAEQTLKQFMPILFIELDDNNLKAVDSNAKELILFLEKLNYQLINAQTNQQVSSNNNFENCHFDVIAK